MSEQQKSPVGVTALDAHVEDKQKAAELERLKKMSGYTVRSAANIYRKKVERPTEIWGGIDLENSVYEIIGMSGIGKSRIVLNLALRQCIAETVPDIMDEDGNKHVPEFAGLPLYKGKIKWLLLGTENGIYRYSYDLKHMINGLKLTEDQIKLLDERLFMTTLEGEGDTYMAVDGIMPEGGAKGNGGDLPNGNFEKLRATIAQVEPDIIVFDPWGDVICGSEKEDEIVRRTVVMLKQLHHGIKETMPIIIVNHARNGLAENVKAIKLEAANFGKNSKALYTMSRCVWNLVALEDKIGCQQIGLINAKLSNGKVIKSKAIGLNEETMCYETLWHIDVDKRMEKMAADAGGPQQNKTNIRKAKLETEISGAAEAVMKLFEKHDIVSNGDIELAIRKSGVADRNVKSVKTTLKQAPYSLKTCLATGKHGETMWGSEAAINEYIAKIAAEEEKAKEEAAAEKEKKKAEKEAAKEAAKAAKEAKKAAKKRGRPKGKAKK